MPTRPDDHQPLVDPEIEADLAAQPRVEDLLEQARAEADEWRERAARVQADFDNSRKRLQAAHDEAVKRAAERVLDGLMPVVDDLERAIDHAVRDGAAVAEGLGAVHRKLLALMSREGCEPIDPAGTLFDSSMHEAVGQVPDPGSPEGTVVEVVRKGYLVYGRVARPAMVVVSTKGPASPGE